MSSQEELNVSNEDLEKKLAKLVSTLGMHLCYIITCPAGCVGIVSPPLW